MILQRGLDVWSQAGIVAENPTQLFHSLKGQGGGGGRGSRVYKYIKHSRGPLPHSWAWPYHLEVVIW